MKFAAEPHLAGLKQFQRRTVDHVTKRMFDDTPAARRFLVADETGLGKSHIAKGVIAETIERLQHDPSVNRIDIVYVCSNANIAQQNLERLDILGSGTRHHSTRLTLLARDSGELNGKPHPLVGKRVNLISFTPGTSFDVRYGGGAADERALLHRILATDLCSGGIQERALAVLLQGRVAELDTFWRAIDNLSIEPDAAITTPFLQLIRTSGLRRRLVNDIERIGRRTRLSDDERLDAIAVVGELRAALAKAGVSALEPDLVILDEFQRFRHLLDPDEPNFREAAELAHALFDYGDARVLLLSATPYKPFTYAEEAAAGDDHEADLRKVLTFLGGGESSGADIAGIVADLSEFRRCAVGGSDHQGIRTRLEQQLTRLMCRTERPRLGDDGMLAEHITTAESVTADDITEFGVIRKVAEELEAPLNVEYWKSTPYFINFADGYQLGDRLRAALGDPERRARLLPLLRSARRLERERVDQLTAIDPGNARMRELADATVGAGWWRLLWMPPSLPYQAPGGPFAEIGPVSKRLVFSSWSATPTAIASLLSHDATRRMAHAPGRMDSVGRRLDWRLSPDGRPAAMTTLMLFWPVPDVALAADPRVAHDPLAGHAGNESLYWTSLLGGGGSLPGGLTAADAVDALTGRSDADDVDDGAESSRLGQHVDLVLGLAPGRRDPQGHSRTMPDRDDDTLASLATYAPANVAYRCVHRIAGAATSDAARWRAAAIIASGLRTLFNRPESILLLDQLLPGAVYWRAVLSYCAWGNLEAVLDEYLHHLGSAAVAEGMTDERLLELAAKVNASVTLRPAPYEAFDPLHPTKPIVFTSRFALRFGSKRATSVESSRQPDIQAAFNSPFWPFVLATTSIGQEGIDLHWWCHATCHWNTPASPVDFEQREGRVSRYGGLAIRRNLAELHRDELVGALRATANPWDLAFELGASSADDQFDELAPHWICNGSTKVERHLFPYPLSSDRSRYERLKEDLVLYRLTFGQPRQEDLLELLRRRGVGAAASKGAELRLDLRPPLPD